MPHRHPSARHHNRRENDVSGVRTLSPVSVRVRAVIPYEGGIVVAREQRRGEPYLTIPGGRVGPGETVIGTLVREVREETRLDIEIGSLLYVAEVLASSRRQDLNLIFLASIVGEPAAGIDVIGPEEEVDILPPILDRIRHDQAAGWEAEGAWLGNVWDGDLTR